MKLEKKTRGKLFDLFALVLVFLLSLLWISVLWAADHFGNVSMDSIFFTLNTPLEGTGSGFVGDYLRAVSPALVIFLVLLIDLFRPKKRTFSIPWRRHGEKTRLQLYPVRTSGPVLLLVCLFLFGGAFRQAERSFGIVDFITHYFDRSTLIEEEYVSPDDVSITFPEEKRNLIYILMESGETSLQDIENGGLFQENYIPEMTRIARENVSFSQSDRLEGAETALSGWTIAGMVAEFAGLPLKVGAGGNGMGDYEYFLPGATALGDILLREGYHNYFMLGSDIKFAGRDHFMAQHGDYEIWDYHTAIEKGKIPPDYYVWWGYEDQKLYQYAKEELTRLAAEDAPFNFTMLTVDTHHPEGYICPLCRDDYDEQYANVWACASRQLDEFLSWLREQPFYDNTTVVICGDHCSMAPEFFNKPELGTHRLVYNAILNPALEPVQEKNRIFTTMDMFPTTLAALGASIDGERLGLGTNLFSDQPTLSERIGYDVLYDELTKTSTFYNEELLFKEAP